MQRDEVDRKTVYCRYTIKQKSTRISLFRWRRTQTEIVSLLTYFYSYCLQRLTIFNIYKIILNVKNFVDNEDDGKYRTLNSKRKKCTMLFPVKVTDTAVKEKHDMSYGKSYNPNGIVKTL